MTRTDFFEALKDNCSTEKEYLIGLIKLRGFLLVEKDNRLYMSDNSHSDDPKYLDSLLRKYEIGRLNINIPITNTTDPTKVRSRNFTKLFFEETLNKRNQIISNITPPTISCQLIPIFAF